MARRPTAKTRHVNAAFGSRTDVGCTRDHNEDSLVVAPPLYAVADGMGGHAAGEVASEISVQVLEQLAPHTPDTEALNKAVVAANRAVIDAAQEKGRLGMGTTLTAAILEGEQLAIAQVGDSRAYLLHQGNLQQLTRDHSLMAEMIEAGELTPEEARVHPRRSVITRALGSDPDMLPDLYELNVSAGDRLLVCSDGLTSMLEDREIERILQRHRDPQRCANTLVNEAISAGGLDNVTVIVVDVEGNAPREERKARNKSRIGAVALAIALFAIIAGVFFGVYQYSQSQYYLVAEDGVVSVYRGVPGTIMGFSLSSLDHTTDVQVDQLQPGTASRLTDSYIPAGSKEDAERIVAEYQSEIAQSQEESQEKSGE